MTAKSLAYQDAMNGIAILYDALTNAENELDKLKNPWIKCSDELPPVLTRVLVYGKWYNSNVIGIGLRADDNDWMILPALESVIYWRPLPPPPEDL